MPDYNQWNSALVDFFLSGAPTGSTIYLDVTDRNLQLIGEQTWPSVDRDDWPDDFLQAVRDKLVRNGTVRVRGLQARWQASTPNYVAFLGVLVLVATRMDRDTENNISERDYFTRLNEALDTEPANRQVRRPRHMTSGATAEEPLWQQWASFLRTNGYLPTASAGRGAWRYIGYAVSQTLVREHEKRSLWNLYDQRGWPRDIDGETLASYLRQEQQVPSHVKALLGRTGPGAEDVQHALLETYLEWLEAPTADRRTPNTSEASRHVAAGLYRYEHWRTGEPAYALLPRQPRHVRHGRLTVALPDGDTPLLAERPGFFAPVSVVTPEVLDAGARFPVQGERSVEALVLPRRDFWLLLADPDAPGVHATFRTPAVGEHFLLLVRNELEKDLHSFREYGLLKWARSQAWAEGWTEYHDTMVTANHWSELQVGSSTLRDALTPRTGVSITLSGGLQIGKTSSWLAEAPPTAQANSFFSNVRVIVAKDDEIILDGPTEANNPIDVPWQGPGSYVLDIEARDHTYRRLVNLIDWNHLPSPDSDALGAISISVGSEEVVGPVVRFAAERREP